MSGEEKGKLLEFDMGSKIKREDYVHACNELCNATFWDEQSRRVQETPFVLRRKRSAHNVDPVLPHISATSPRVRLQQIGRIENIYKLHRSASEDSYAKACREVSKVHYGVATREKISALVKDYNKRLEELNAPRPRSPLKTTQPDAHLPRVAYLNSPSAKRRARVKEAAPEKVRPLSPAYRRPRKKRQETTPHDYYKQAILREHRPREFMLGDLMKDRRRREARRKKMGILLSPIKRDDAHPRSPLNRNARAVMKQEPDPVDAPAFEIDESEDEEYPSMESSAENTDFAAIAVSGNDEIQEGSKPSPAPAAASKGANIAPDLAVARREAVRMQIEAEMRFQEKMRTLSRAIKVGIQTTRACKTLMKPIQQARSSRANSSKRGAEMTDAIETEMQKLAKMRSVAQAVRARILTARACRALMKQNHEQASQKPLLPDKIVPTVIKSKPSKLMMKEVRERINVEVKVLNGMKETARLLLATSAVFRARKKFLGAIKADGSSDSSSSDSSSIDSSSIDSCSEEEEKDANRIEEEKNVDEDSDSSSWADTENDEKENGLRVETAEADAEEKDKSGGEASTIMHRNSKHLHVALMLSPKGEIKDKVEVFEAGSPQISAYQRLRRAMRRVSASIKVRRFVKRSSAAAAERSADVVIVSWWRIVMARRTVQRLRANRKVMAIRVFNAGCEGANGTYEATTVRTPTAVMNKMKQHVGEELPQERLYVKRHSEGGAEGKESEEESDPEYIYCIQHMYEGKEFDWYLFRQHVETNNTEALYVAKGLSAGEGNPSAPPVRSWRLGTKGVQPLPLIAVQIDRKPHYYVTITGAGIDCVNTVFISAHEEGDEPSYQSKGIVANPIDAHEKIIVPLVLRRIVYGEDGMYLWILCAIIGSDTYVYYVNSELGALKTPPPVGWCLGQNGQEPLPVVKMQRA